MRHAGRLPLRSAIVFILLMRCDIAAQTPATKEPITSFDVVSVKPSSGDNRPSVRSSPGRFTAINQPLSLYITEAYGVMPHALVDAPEWIYREHFDIEATVPGNVVVRRTMQPLGPMRYMPPLLEKLLEERFALRVRRETRQLRMYRLKGARADGKLGPNLRSVVVDCTPQPGQPPRCSLGGSVRGYGAVGIEWPGYLIGSLSNHLRAHVSDETGLTGQFDVTLEWTRELTAGVDGNSALDSVSIFAAVQEQLGLKLEATHGPVEVLVVEHVERPTPN